MEFSIITPSFRGSQWLKLCVASVADQGVALEHIVQDACSDDGTEDWLPKDPRVKAFVEKDSGMYDAVNRGLRRAQGEILAYLNCDEQYTPDALKQVQHYFQTHPAVDIVFADTVVVADDGAYICERWSLPPQKHHTMVSFNLAFLTCAAFFRRRLVDNLGIFFEPALKDVGDSVWALQLIEKKVRMGIMREFTSVFTETGDNMSRKENATRERQQLYANAPRWARILQPLILAHFRWRRFLAGAYFPKPHAYAIYTLASPIQRKTFHVAQPTYRWIRT
jgi:glycosyltransferase involved in cell wall biosynthesis